MSLSVGEFYTQILIPIIVPFLVGLTFGFTYNRISVNIRKIIPKVHKNTSVINAITSEYARRMEKYDSAIADLRVRLDVIELQNQKHLLTQQLHSTESTPSVTLVDASHDPSHDQSQHPSFHAYHRSKRVEPLREISGDVSDSNDVQNGTAEYVLKLLDGRSMTSKEVQHAIGRSREHTSRLMKRLCEYGFITRDSNNKPFTYALAEAGQLRLKERHHVTQASLNASSISHLSRAGSSIKE
jgi:predicted transcriptional regulator